MPGVNVSKSGDNYYVVFVVYNNKFNDLTSVPDFYIVERKEIAVRCYRAKYQLEYILKTRSGI